MSVGETILNVYSNVGNKWKAKHLCGTEYGTHTRYVQMHTVQCSAVLTNKEHSMKSA